jgi:pimeloyl-ACP methyl ester carboxylesterase
LSGEKSNYILPQDEFSIKQQFPDSVIRKVPRAGHWVQAENPKDFSQLVREFLNT